MDAESIIKGLGKEGTDAYICAPNEAKTVKKSKENLAKVQRYCRYTLLQGYSPICSYLFLPNFLNAKQKEDRELIKALKHRYLTFADVLLIFLNSDRLVSKEMQEEIEYAQSLDMPFKFVTEAEVNAELKKDAAPMADKKKETKDAK